MSNTKLLDKPNKEIIKKHSSNSLLHERRVIEITKSTLFFNLGLIVADLIYELRFRNPLLLREFMLFAQEGNVNGYFLTWAFLPVLFSMGLIVYIVLLKKRIRQHDKT